MSLLIPVITILMLLMIVPCIINCLNHFFLCPGQQAKTCSASSTRIYKTTANHENITHPQMDTAIRTLRLETSKGGRPNTPRHPSSAGSSQKDLDAPIPKELGLPSLGGMLGSQNRQQESKMAVAKRQGREKPVKIEQRKVKGRSQDRSEGFRQNSTPD